jgi:integrase
MATVYYFVRSSAKKQKPKANIRVRFGIGNNYFYGKTPIITTVESWNSKKQKVEQELFKSGELAINTKLLRLESHIIDAYNQLNNKNDMNSSWLGDQIDNFFSPISNENKDDKKFWDFVEEFIKKAPNMVIKKTGKKLSPATITKYKLTQRYINEVLKEYNPKLLLKNVDYNFYEEFYEFLVNEKLFAANNVGKHIDTLKVFLNAARRRGYTIHNDIEFFVEPSEDSENTYLREDELDVLFKKDLSHTAHLERVRDLFIVGCWTGLRYSDLTSLEKDDLSSDKIKVTNFKTGAKVILPLHQQTKSILEKYNFELPIRISNQKFNEYIKDACEAAEINESFAKSITKGGKKQTTIYPKFKVVTSHTARRTFATNLYKRGISHISIMALTGHKTEKAFLSYIKVTPEEHAEMLQKVFDEDMIKL